MPQGTDITFIAPEEFLRMEKLLGSLLIDASDRETQLVLHIHERLIKIKQAQSSRQETVSHLIKMAQQTL